MKTDTGIVAFVFLGYKYDKDGNIINQSNTLMRNRKNNKRYIKKKKDVKKE